METTDPQVVSWCNERVRTIADKITALRYAVLAYQADYLAQGIAAQITAAGAGEVVQDWSGQEDGHSRITGTQVINQKAGIDALATALTVTLVAGVGATIAAINDAIQVNGAPR